MMRAAIYARRSTEEHQAASLDVQTQEAIRFAESKGWSVDERHVFVDDAVSRAEFKKRPGLIAMINGAETGAFDVVVCRDETRLGGDTNRTCLLIQELLDADVQLFYYFTSERVTLDGAMQKIMVSLRNFASELEREKISQRTHEHLQVKARKGLNVGGRDYGYDNIEIKDGERRVRVEYAVNDREAAIIRRIFTRYAEGAGLKRIAKELNASGVLSPRAGKRGTSSWSTSAIGSMLRNERYRGFLVWGRREKTYRGGTKVRIPRAEAEWVRVENSALRIVDDDLWFGAHAQMTTHVMTTEKKGGRAPQYLLSGTGRCHECGGPMQVINGKAGNLTIKAYACSYYRQRGKTVCSNSLRRPVASLNELIVGWIREHVLSEEVLLETIAEIRSRLADRAKATTRDLPDREREATGLRREIDRLVRALAATDEQPDAIVRAIAEKQERLRDLDARMRASKAAPEAIELEVRRLDRDVRERVADFRAVLDRRPEDARALVAALFPGQLKFTPVELPEGLRYRVEGEAVVGHLLATEPGVTKMASPAGFECA